MSIKMTGLSNLSLNNINNQQNSWYSGQYPTQREVYARLYDIYKTNPQKARQLDAEYQQMRTDPTSWAYSPYSQATNQAVGNLKNLGFDTSLLNDDFFADQNNQAWIRSNLDYRSGSGNTPSAPTKNSTPAQKVAYELYQWKLAEDYTQSAESEAKGAIDYVKYWAGRKDLNMSADDIIKKYKAEYAPDHSKTLTDMQDRYKKDRYKLPELNRGVDLSDDVLYAAIWEAWNPEYNGNIEGAMVYSYLGEGNTWQDDPEKRMMLSPLLDDDVTINPNFKPYAVTGTNLDEAAFFFGVDSFPEDWLEKNYHYKVNGTPEEKKYYAQVEEAEANTKAAEAALKALEKWAGDKIGTDPGKVQKKFDDLLAGGKLYIKGDKVYTSEMTGAAEVDLSILNRMDVTMGKNGSLPTGKLLAMTRPVDYKYSDYLARLNEMCQANASKGTDADTAGEIDREAMAEETAETSVPETPPAEPEKGPAEAENEPAEPEEAPEEGVDAVTGAAPDVQQAEAAAREKGAKEQEPFVPTDLGPVRSEAEKEQIKAQNEKISDAADTVETVATDSEAAMMRRAGSVVFKQNVEKYHKITGMDKYQKSLLRKGIDIQTNDLLTTGLDAVHAIADYKDTEARLAAEKKRYAELEKKYGNIEYLQKEFEPYATMKVGDYNVVLTFNNTSEGEYGYVVTDIYSGDLNATYKDIIQNGNADAIIAQVEPVAREMTNEAIKILAAHNVANARGEEGRQEVQEYKNLVPAIYNDETYIEENTDNYEQQNAAMAKYTDQLAMLYESAVSLGEDTSGILEAYRFLEDMTNYYKQPALPVFSMSKLEYIDYLCGEYGVELTNEQKSQQLHDGIAQIDKQIEALKEDWAYAEKKGFQIPDNYQRNMGYKLDDLEYEKKAFEYSAILTDTDPEEMEKAIAAGKAFEEKYGDSMQAFQGLYGSDDNPEYYFTLGKKTQGVTNDDHTEYKFITDDDRRVYYYLLGKKVEQYGDEFAKLWEDRTFNGGMYDAKDILTDILKDADDFVEFMNDGEYGIWTTKRAISQGQWGQDMVNGGKGSGIVANLASTLITPFESLANMGYAFDRLATGKRFNQYANARSASIFKEQTRAETFKSIDEAYADNPTLRDIARLGYEIYVNRGDSMMNSLFFGMFMPAGGMFTGKFASMMNEFVGAAPMGFTAAVNAASEAASNGASQEQVWLIFGATFCAETLTEAINYGNIQEAIGVTGSLTKESLKTFFKEWLTKNGFEEMFGESLNDIVENAANRYAAERFDNSDYESDHQKLVDYYMSEGFGPEEADGKAYEQELKGIMHTAFVSYLSAGSDVFVKTGKAAVNTFTDVMNGYRGYTRLQQKNGYSTSMAGYMLQDAMKAFGKADTRTRLDTVARNEEAVNEQYGSTDNTNRSGNVNADVNNKAAVSGQAADMGAAILTANQRKNAAQVAAISRVGIANTTAQTEMIASILDNGDSESGVSEQAEASAAFLADTLGDDASYIVQQAIAGCMRSGVSTETVTTALQNAALGSGAATALVQSNAFLTATPEMKAQMLAGTVEQDQSNPEVQRNIAAKTKEFRTGMVINDLAAQGHFEQAQQDREAANKAAAETAKAETQLGEKQDALQAAKDDLQTKDEQFQNEPTDDNLKQRQDAVTRVDNADESMHQYEQHLENMQEAQKEAEAKADKSANDAMNSAREQANQAVEQEDQQRAQTAFERAEQERIAREQAEQEAAQRQAEEDEATGKAQEDLDNAAIEQAVSEETERGQTDENEAENRKDDLKEQAEKVKMKLRDLKKPVSSAEGMLALKAFERKLGIKINLEDMGAIQKEGWTRGKYSDGVITLNQNMTLGQALVEAALHEITHSMRNTGAYNAYRKVVLESVFGASGDINSLYESNDGFRAKVDATIDERIAAGDRNFVGKTHEQQVAAAEDEIVADFARLNLAEKDVVQRFMDAGMGGKMRNMLHNINQALKNYFGNMDSEERKTAEYLRRAERAFQKAIDQVARTSEHPESSQFSIAQIAQSTGMTFNEETLQLFDRDGNEIDGVNRQITPDMIKDTPVGLLIANGLSDQSPGVDENGNPIDSPQVAASKMMAGLMNMVARYKDSNLVWEIGATTLSSTFSALKSNSDPQYKTTVDFGTVCAKTQAIIDTLSQVMLDKVKNGEYGGLDRKDVMKVYDAVNKAGLSVPCPVCYVFSRWMGVPSLLGQMSQYQHDYVATNEDGTINKEATQAKVDEYIAYAQEQYGDAKAINKKKANLQKKQTELEEKRVDLVKQKNDKNLTEEQKKDIQDQLEAVLDEQVKVDDELGKVEAYNWITQSLCKQDGNGKYVVDDKFRITPDEILFDLNRTGEFAGYEKNWRYRNTRGAGMGKSIMPYSGETIGDILYGVKKGGRQSSIKNPWTNMDGKAAAKQLREARARAIKQNLVGGQRLQSTSDFRPEWGLDYIMSFLELQAAGSKVQMYTKVAEAVDFFASVGADVNLSIMGKGQGWHVDENGNYVLDFSSVTGMDYETAKALKDKYDNVQMILVGMNDTHIRLALANSDIDFVIPWHSSGNSKDVISGLMSTFKESLENGHNYEDSQTDKVSETQTAEQKALWDARMKLLTKGDKALTEEDRLTLLSNPITKELYRRFTEKGVDDECYGVKLSKEQASQIFPYEYWDTSLTKDQADQNGKRFTDYCEAMGIVPRFSQFKDDTGYWKLLIDRPMYNNDGTYHQQSVIDVTNARIGNLNESGQLENSDLPTQAQAKYAPKDPRNPNYAEYTAAQQRAVENAEAAINNQYDDGSEGQYSVYGDLTEADIAMMNDAAKDYESAIESGDRKAVRQDIEYYAEKKGYTDRAFHGSDYFGFTEFDTSEETSQGEIFVAYDRRTAGTYTLSDELKNISDMDFRHMDNDRLIDTAKKVIGMTGESVNDITYNEETGMFEFEFDDGTEEMSREDVAGTIQDFLDEVREKKPVKRTDNEERFSGGIYRLYTRPGNQLVVDANGAKWNQIDFNGKKMTTREIGKWAKENGYDSVRINDVIDNGKNRSWGDTETAGDIGIFFNGNDVKSGDLVTRDNDGNVIPLNERFNDQEKDIRYSNTGEMTEADQAMLDEAKKNETLKKAGVLTQEEIDAYNEKTSRPMEGKSMKWSQEEGPAQRQFGGEEGMLQESELDQKAIDYAMKHNAYFPDTNEGQIRRAINWIKKNGSTKNEDGTWKQTTDGYYESVAKVTSKTFDYRSADGQARMIATMAMAVAKNDIRTQVELADAFNRQGTDLGRAMQTRKIFRMMTPTGRIAAIQKMLTNAQEEIKAKTGKDVDLTFSDWIYRAAAAATEDGDFRQVYEAAKAELIPQLPASWKEKLVGIRMFSMLCGTTTHIRNTTGNLLMLGLSGTKNKVGALGEIILQQAGLIKEGERTKTLRLRANPEARAFAKADLENVRAELDGDSKYQDSLTIQQKDKKLYGQGKSLFSKTIGKAFQALYGANSAALEFEDRIFLNRNYRNALAGYMTANKLTAESMTGETLDKAREYAITEAVKATFHDASRVASWLNDRNLPEAARVAIDALLPFKKTPINIAKRGFEYSPLGLIKSVSYDAVRMIQYQKALRNGDNPPIGAISPQQWIDKVAAGVTGSGLTALGYLLGSMGMARAGFDDDDPEDKIAKLKGEQEYSINPGKIANAAITAVGRIFDSNYEFNLFGEDVTYTLDWAAPSVLPMYIGVAAADAISDYKEAVEKGDDAGSPAGKILHALFSMTEPMFNMTVLQSLNSALEVSQYEDGNVATKIGEKTALNWISSFVPSFVGKIAKTIDRTKRQTYTMSGDDLAVFNRSFEQIENKIPFISSNNAPSVNEWGEEDTKGLLESIIQNFISPGYWKKMDTSERMQEIERLYQSTRSKNVVPKSVPKYFDISDENGAVKQTIRLDDQQYYQMKKTAGETQEALISTLISTDLYQMADDRTRARMLNYIYNYSLKTAQYQLDNRVNIDTGENAWMGEAYKDGYVLDRVVDKVMTENRNAYIKSSSISISRNMIDGKWDDVEAEIEILEDKGVDRKELKSDVADYFRPIYYDAYSRGEEDSVNNIIAMLYKLDVGFDKKTFNSWNKNVDKKTDKWSVKDDEYWEENGNWLNP